LIAVRARPRTDITPYPESLMATLMDYARIAKAIYKDHTSGEVLDYLVENGVTGYGVRFWQAGTASNGFQGAILESDKEVICAYKGSAKGVTWKQDWLINDVQIFLNLLPSQTNSAVEMVAVAEQYICGGRGNRSKPISIVGHSLGGGLAQVVGYLMGVPFVTFNGPGMAGNIELIPGVGFTKPKSKGSVNGFNMILWQDPVGNFGRHLGKTERFRNRGGFPAHIMENVITTLEAKLSWASKMLHQLL